MSKGRVTAISAQPYPRILPPAHLGKAGEDTLDTELEDELLEEIRREAEGEDPEEEILEDEDLEEGEEANSISPQEG